MKQGITCHNFDVLLSNRLFVKINATFMLWNVYRNLFTCLPFVIRCIYMYIRTCCLRRTFILVMQIVFWQRIFTSRILRKMFFRESVGDPLWIIKQKIIQSHVILLLYKYQNSKSSVIVGAGRYRVRKLSASLNLSKTKTKVKNILDKTKSNFYGKFCQCFFQWSQKNIRRRRI